MHLDGRHLRREGQGNHCVSLMITTGVSYSHNHATYHLVTLLILLNAINRSLSCNSCPVRAIGTLPASLGTLDMANSLNLESNAFFGQLPTEWGAPNQFPSLINLFLDGNNLTGTIPTVFPQLQLLRLDGNHLSGTLNISLVMPSLQVFRIFNNNLTGNLPSDFWTRMFPQLQIFAGQQNEFQQSLPVVWASGAASQLNELYLQQNSLSGGLPAAWGDPKAFPVLRYLTLGSNPFGGQLPEALGQSNSFPQLRSL